MKKLLVVDNYDSFTYNLVHIVKELGNMEVEVHRNDRISLDRVERFDKIILSPGPGIPCEAGILLPLIRQYAPRKSILGICLGHQTIAEAFGGRLINLAQVFHGVSSEIETEKDKLFVHPGLHPRATVGRYHSWVVDPVNDFPQDLEIIARDSQGQVMAIRHREYDVRGVQFHPESVLTPYGKEIIKEFLDFQ